MHACMQGCDGSILLDNALGKESEKDAIRSKGAEGWQQKWILARVDMVDRENDSFFFLYIMIIQWSEYIYILSQF